MNTTQRVQYLDIYRSKLHKELDQMQYGRVWRDLPSPTKHPAGIWAATIAGLLITGSVISQAL